MSPTTSWRAVWRRWPIVLLVVVLALGAAAVVVSGLSPRYEASAEVLVEAPADPRDVPASEIGSYAHVLGGTAMVRRATETLGIPRVPMSDVRGAVVPGTDVLEVTVTDDDLDGAEELAGQTAEEFTLWLEAKQDDLDADQRLTTIVIDSGTGSREPVGPDTRPIWLGAALLGLLLGIALARWRQLSDRGITSTDDLRDGLGVPVLGAVAHDRHTPQRPLVTDLETDHPRAEAIRILRTNLQFVDVDHDRTVITVTSSLPGEGKTTTACNLALSLAQSGQQVALVEGDLRRPEVAGTFGLEQQVGLTTVLVGRVTLDEALQPTTTPGLDVLASGALPPNPAEIIQTGAMESLVQDLRRRYDVVLIDAPPLLPVADAALLAMLSDGALLVVRHGRTGHDQVRAAVERLSNVGARLFGTVLSMSPRRDSARYGYGYAYAEPSRRRARR